ncbi:MAG: hypothetical protein WD981_04695 [Gaiellaceae bacterium]
MTRRDWLLVYFALKGAPRGLDPVRIQKGMFLFAQEGGVSDEETYDFGPYQYGPMSSELYADLDRLEAEGLIRGEPVPGYTWKRYTVTPGGMDVARHLLEDADGQAARRLFEIKHDVASKTFNALLRDVYTRYPKYATRSVFRG